jgi:hypothetical protein
MSELKGTTLFVGLDSRKEFMTVGLAPDGVPRQRADDREDRENGAERVRPSHPSASRFCHLQLYRPTPRFSGAPATLVAADTAP